MTIPFEDITSPGYTGPLFPNQPVSPTSPTSPSGDSGESTLTTSDKKKIEELASMMPKTWIDPMIMAQLWLNMNGNLGLNTVGSDKRPLTTSVENAVIFTMLNGWMQSLEQNKKAMQEVVERERLDPTKVDPLVIALKAYVQSGGAVSGINMQLMQSLKSSPLATAALNSIDPELLIKAFKVAMQKMVINVLDKVIEDAAEIRDTQRKTIKNRDLVVQQERAQQLLADYVKDIKSGKLNLSQPILSIVLSGYIGGNAVQVPIVIDTQTGKAVIDRTRDALLPTGSEVLLNSIETVAADFPPALKAAFGGVAATLTEVMAHTAASAAYWSVPSALTLQATAPPGEKGPEEASVRAYAITISKFILRPDFDQFIKVKLLQHTDLSKIPPEHIDQFIATMKVMLLTNSLAALVKTGLNQGVVVNGKEILDLIHDPAGIEEGDMRLTLVKLIREFMKVIPEKAQEQIKAEIHAYLDTNPDVAALVDPTSVFLKRSDPSVALHVASQQRADK